MMNPKETLFAVLRHETVSQVPWVPFAGVHAGFLAGYDATEVLTDADKLVQSLLEVNRLYKPHGQPVVFDLQLEAECLGCELRWVKNGPPSVMSHPLEQDPVIPCRCTIPDANSGRLPVVLDAMRRMKTAVGETTALYGLICGPFTLASHLRGNDIFMDLYDDEDFVAGLLNYCREVGEAVARLYVEAGMDVIAVVDPLISQISASHFEQFMSPVFHQLFDTIRSLGVFSSFFVCGDATRNIEVMCQTGPDSIAVDENVDLRTAKTISDRYNIAMGGNIPLTSVMLLGTQQSNMKAVVDIFDHLESRDNFILSPGCDMPYDVPVENVVGVTQAVLHEDEVRVILRDYHEADDDSSEAVDLPDYSRLKKPLVEVFTLDSATCAACTYMMGAATAAKDAFGDQIDLIEYKATTRDNLARIRAMGVRNLPSMYINGTLKYRSLIPSRQELHSAISAAIEALR